MAWCLAPPHRFGIYFPDGDFVGWRVAAARRYLDIASPQEAARMRALGDAMVDDYVLAQILYDWSTKFRRDEGRLEPEGQPKEYALERTPRRELASSLQVTDQLYVVDSHLKALIEEFEPGVHQFWPLKLTLPDGSDYPNTYHGMIILSWVKCLSPLNTEDPDGIANLGSRGAIENLILDRSAIEGRHLWQASDIGTNINAFISEDLRRAIKSRGLKIFPHYKVREA